MSDRGVSPVVEIILMVTITVILAAVITAFIFDMAEHADKNNTTASNQVNGIPTKTIILTFQDGSNLTLMDSYCLRAGAGTLDVDMLECHGPNKTKVVYPLTGLRSWEEK